MKVEFYTVKCSSCGGDIKYYHSHNFRSETDAQGRERYYHYKCPEQESEEDLLHPMIAYG